MPAAAAMHDGNLWHSDCFNEVIWQIIPHRQQNSSSAILAGFGISDSVPVYCDPYRYQSIFISGSEVIEEQYLLNLLYFLYENHSYVACLLRKKFLKSSNIFKTQ